MKLDDLKESIYSSVRVTGYCTRGQSDEITDSVMRIPIIAAAPDLLEAATNALEIMEKAKKLLKAAGFAMDGGTVSEPYCESMEILKAAIAKATQP